MNFIYYSSYFLRPLEIIYVYSYFDLNKEGNIYVGLVTAEQMLDINIILRLIQKSRTFLNKYLVFVYIYALEILTELNIFIYRLNILLEWLITDVCNFVFVLFF